MKAVENIHPANDAGKAKASWFILLVMGTDIMNP